MAEVIAEAKLVLVHMRCPACDIGLMKGRSELMLPTNPPKYEHKCEYCGNFDYYDCIYPHQEIVQIEEFRKPDGIRIGKENDYGIHI